MANGNVSIQTAGGANTLGVIAASGYGLSFLQVLYRYANLTLPYSPNDPGLTYTYDNSTLVPVVLLQARFFNLLNEPSVPIVANVGTSAFGISGGVSGFDTSCLDVRSFGAVGDGATDDTAAIQRALNQAYSNFLGNQQALNSTSSQSSQPVQSIAAHVENGSGSILTLTLPTATIVGNTMILTFCAFDYGSGPGSPATPAVTDNRGNTYFQASSVANGEFLLYTYYARIISAGATTLSISIGGRQFNSFISAIAMEFNGVQVPIAVDGQATSVNNSGFTAPVLAATNKGDLIVYAVLDSTAAGLPPIAPSDFTLVTSQITPQPNGLNGALPVLATAYRNWSGTPSISSTWTPLVQSGCASMVAFRQVPLAPSAPGKTTVCIPSGVNCMVSPVIFDHAFPGHPWDSGQGQRYYSMAYSLVLSDGVTMDIEGSLIANPNANSFSISGNQDAGYSDYGWALFMNSAWLLNKTIGTQLILTQTDGIVPWSAYLAGTAFNEGLRNNGIKITGNGKVYLNGGKQVGVLDTPAGPGQLDPVALARFYCADNSTIENIEVIAPFIMAVEWGHSVNIKINNVFIHDAPNAGSNSNSPGGILELDMIRNSNITNNTIVNCPLNQGILDFAGYQNTISGNTFNGCYTGYEYRDLGGEFPWRFGPPQSGSGWATTLGGYTFGNITHNSQITQNKALNCTTSPQQLSFPVIQSGQTIAIVIDTGSDGFDFNAGWAATQFDTQQLCLPVTGTGFHDNIASGNTTDVYASAFMAFQSSSNNSFTSGGTPVSNGVNTVTGEVPSGLINGTNTIFTLSHIPVSGSVTVYLNGLQQYAGTDFTSVGASITLAVAPNSGSVITVNYQYLSGN